MGCVVGTFVGGMDGERSGELVGEKAGMSDGATARFLFKFRSAMWARPDPMGIIL